MSIDNELNIVNNQISSLEDTKEEIRTAINEKGVDVPQSASFRSYANSIRSIQGGANTDLSNLTEEGEKHFLNYNQITNCITEIPQRIKLELNDGVLTLKAGSIVTVPNGFEEDGVTRHFDYIEVTEDITHSGKEYSLKRFVLYNVNGNHFGLYYYVYSGDTEPILPTSGDYFLWYDTANNIFKVKETLSSAWTVTNLSLPVGVATNVQNTGFTEINSIFNGMGYVGGISWVDKDVKALFPNGRNEDGSLKNIEKIFSNVALATLPLDTKNDYLTLMFSDKTLGNRVLRNCFIQEDEPIAKLGQTQYWYNPKTNISYSSAPTETTWTISQCFPCIYFSIKSGAVLDFKTTQPIYILKRSDFSELSGIGMPSKKHINLTLGADGALYTAPSNGYFVVSNLAKASGQRLSMVMMDGTTEGGVGYSIYSSASGQYLTATLDVKKDTSIKIFYTTTGDNYKFRFYYAEGEV